MNLHQTLRPFLRARDTACSTCSSVMPFRIASSSRLSGFDAQLELLEVRSLEQAHEIVVHAIHPGLRRGLDAAVQVSRNDPLEDRLRPSHVQPERLVLDPDPRRSIAREDLVYLVETLPGVVLSA